jgi:hypothetical protein
MAIKDHFGDCHQMEAAAKAAHYEKAAQDKKALQNEKASHGIKKGQLAISNKVSATTEDEVQAPRPDDQWALSFIQVNRVQVSTSIMSTECFSCRCSHWLRL